MSSVSVLQAPQNINKKQPKIKNKGFLRSQYASSLITAPLGFVPLGIGKVIKNISRLSKEDSFQLLNAAEQGLKNTGLAQKGIEIFQMEEVPLKEVNERCKTVFSDLIHKKDTKNLLATMNKAMDYIFKFGEKDQKVLSILEQAMKANSSNAFQNNIQESIIKLNAKNATIAYKMGNNACFIPKLNKIITPDKSYQTTVFHEMGHALNGNGSVLLKGLKKCKGLTKLAPIIMLVALLNKRKTTDETQTNDSKIQKGADFVKRNAGKLTALTYLPLVAEEGLASLRGQGVAKKLVKDGQLSKEIFKKVKLTNLIAFSSYIFVVGVTVLTTKLAIKIKDKIQAKYEEKQAQKLNK